MRAGGIREHTRPDIGGHPLQRKRIVVTGRPELLRQLLARAIDAEDDMTVVERLTANVDAVVFSAVSDAPLRTVLDHLGAQPARQVLVLEHDASQWTVWTLRPHRTDMGEPSLDRVMDILRGEDVDPPVDPN